MNAPPKQTFHRIHSPAKSMPTSQAKRLISCLACVHFPGILYKGSGENQFISLQPPVISTIMGNGRRRSISCPSCNGQALGNKLLAPVALAWGVDGSLYVGDFNYIRRIYPSGNVTSVMELRLVRMSGQLALRGRSLLFYFLYTDVNAELFYNFCIRFLLMRL